MGLKWNKQRVIEIVSVLPKTVSKHQLLTNSLVVELYLDLDTYSCLFRGHIESQVQDSLNDKHKDSNKIHIIQYIPFLHLYNQSTLKRFGVDHNSTKLFNIINNKVMVHNRNHIGIKELIISTIRSDISTILHAHTIMEGMGITELDTKTIIERGNNFNVAKHRVNEVLDLKVSYEYITENYVEINSLNLDYIMRVHYLATLNTLESAYVGKLRVEPVQITGTSYIPPIPDKNIIVEGLNSIINSDADLTTKVYRVGMYLMRSQIFQDGNKRTSYLVMNSLMIAHELGYIKPSVSKDFGWKIVKHYETLDEYWLLPEYVNNHVKGGKLWTVR